MATQFRNDVRDARSLPALLGDIVRDLSDLVREEIALAKVEASEKVTSLQMGIAAIAIGGAVAFAGLIVLLDAAVFALANVLGPIVEDWPALPALIIGLVVVIIGAVMIKMGANRFEGSHLRLSRTAASMRKDQAVVREHLS